MFNYFKELLGTLKKIESHLEAISKNTDLLGKCVKSHHHGHGDTHSLSTKHWND